MENEAQKKVETREQCFVMMPISAQGDYPKGHFEKVYEQIFKPAIEEAGFEAYRVDENSISDSIIGKIFKAIQESPMALCDLSNRNPNVLYELGIRQAYDKPVVLVQDEKTEKIFDISGISTVFYESDRIFEHVIEARKRIAKAIMETKAGKRNSIVRIANAYTAEVSVGTVTKEDRIEIMLSGLMEDVRSLKKNQKADIKSESEIRESGLIEQAVFDKRSIFVKLKNGTTNKQIEQMMERVKKIYDIEVDYFKIDSKVLRVSLYGESDTIEEAVKYLER